MIKQPNVGNNYSGYFHDMEHAKNFNEAQKILLDLIKKAQQIDDRTGEWRDALYRLLLSSPWFDTEKLEKDNAESSDWVTTELERFLAPFNHLIFSKNELANLEEVLNDINNWRLLIDKNGQRFDMRFNKAEELMRCAKEPGKILEILEITIMTGCCCTKVIEKALNAAVKKRDRKQIVGLVKQHGLDSLLPDTYAQ